MPAYPGFIGGSGQSQSALATSERTMNLYLEKIGTQGPQSKMALYPTPGGKLWVGAAAGIHEANGRGGLSVPGSSERAFAVIGGGIYELFATQTVTRRGTVAQNANPAQVVYNGPTGNQLLFASGNNAYLYDTVANTLTTVLTNEATQVGMIDEYFLALNQTTGKLRLSNLNDGLTWSGIQFAFRSAQPDPWKAMVINPPDIWLLGDQTGDIWYDAGTSPFPLAARTGLNIPYGISAPFSLIVIAGAPYWLAKTREGEGIVVRSQGYNPQKISTTELDTAIASYARSSTIADANAFSYQAEGHTFYVLRFPTANATWVYDKELDTWHERGTWNPGQNRYDVWHPQMHLYAFGKHLVGDNATGTIAQLDVTFGTDADGAVIRRMRRGPVLVHENRRMSINRFELALETGLGLSTGQGSNPLVSFRMSVDAGHTFGNERLCGAGRIGEYRRRVFWTRLGSPRLFVPEVVMSDPIPWRIVDAYLNNDDEAQAA